MTDYLLFTLYSPLSSWGEIAVGEVRASKTHPGRSAIFGLIAASLGIRRNNSDAIKELHENFSLGIKVLKTGFLIKDFHTIQAARSQKNVVYRKRADEFSGDPDLLGTIISTREYRSDALYVVAVWQRGTKNTFSLQDINKALHTPVFVPYLGRKSCPPACNFASELICGKETLKDAFECYKIKPIWFCSGNSNQMEYYERRIFQTDAEIYYWDDCDNSGFQKMLVTECYDTVRDAFRRQFSSRKENMTLISKGRG